MSEDQRCVQGPDQALVDSGHHSDNSNTVDDDDDPLLDLDVQQNILAKPGDRARNLVTAYIVGCLLCLTASGYSDIYSQYLYHRYQVTVLGVNYSRLNVSTVKHPCIDHVGGNVSQGHFSRELDQAQSLASDFASRTSIMTYLPAIFTNVLLGAYSDRLGRKIFFVVPIAGTVVCLTIAWVTCYWQLGLWMFYIGALANGVSGSMGAFCMALYAYTADNTEGMKSRSLGMVAAMAASEGMSSVTHVGIGVALTRFGFTWCLATTALLAAITLVVAIVFIRETYRPRADTAWLSLLDGVKAVFSFYFMESADTNHKRKDFILLATTFIVFALSIGMMSIRTLFLMDRPFCWDSTQIGIVLTVTGLIQSLLPIGVLRLLQGCLSDQSVCLVSLLSSFAYCLDWSLARTDFVIYVGIGLGFMSRSVLSLLRAIFTKMVPVDRRGSLLSSLAVMETATAAIAGVSMNQLYSHTVSLWTGLTYFVLSICMLIAAGILVVWIIMKKRRMFNLSKDTEDWPVPINR